MAASEENPLPGFCVYLPWIYVVMCTEKAEIRSPDQDTGKFLFVHPSSIRKLSKLLLLVTCAQKYKFVLNQLKTLRRTVPSSWSSWPAGLPGILLGLVFWLLVPDQRGAFIISSSLASAWASPACPAFPPYQRPSLKQERLLIPSCSHPLWTVTPLGLHVVMPYPIGQSPLPLQTE